MAEIPSLIKPTYHLRAIMNISGLDANRGQLEFQVEVKMTEDGLR